MGAVTFPDNIKTQTFDTYVKSKNTCEVAEISCNNLKYIMKFYPEFLMYLSQQITIRMNHHKIMLNSGGRQSVRIKQLLDTLAKGSDAMTHFDGMQVKISRKEIGLRLNIPSIVVTKELHLLRKQKVIMFKGTSKNIILLGASPTISHVNISHITTPNLILKQYVKLSR